MRANNSEKSSTMKIDEHTPCGYSKSIIWGFGHIKRKHTSSRGKDFMKTFCDFLRERAKNIFDFEKKKILPLTKEELISYQYAEICYSLGRKIKKMFSEDIKYKKVTDDCHYIGKYRGAAHSIAI